MSNIVILKKSSFTTESTKEEQEKAPSMATAYNEAVFHSQIGDLKVTNKGKNTTLGKNVVSILTHAKKAKSNAKTPGYNSCVQARQRCRNPNNPAYPGYGGRGITFHAPWDCFATFIADMGEQPSPHHSLDRIDPNGNYEPGNCRWATGTEQARNRRTTKRVEYNGKKRVLAELAEEHGLALGTLTARLKAGASIHDALRIPVQRGGDHRSHAMKFSKSSGFDRWPELPPDTRQKLEDLYQSQWSRHQLTRPAYFLKRFSPVINDYADQISGSPEQYLQPVREAYITRLSASCDEARDLLGMLQSPRHPAPHVHTTIEETDITSGDEEEDGETS